MDDLTPYFLILIAILEIVDGQGIALRILRLLMRMIGAQPDGEETENIKITEVKRNHSPRKAAST